MREAFSFLPRGFSSLLDYISPAAFEVVDWKSALKRSAKISKELLFGSQIEQVKEILLPLLPEGIQFGSAKKSKTENPRSHSGDRDPGDRLLELYFAQLARPGPAFLDLRSDRFQMDESDLLLWSPNGLWIDFSAEFTSSMNDLYGGFYEDNADRLKHAIKRLGLWPEGLPVDGQNQLLGLLEDHFGQGRTEPMRFEVSHFVQSFDALFLFLKTHKIRVSEEFLFLGIQILTLYMHLEKSGSRYDVARAFAASRKAATCKIQ